METETLNLQDEISRTLSSLFKAQSTLWCITWQLMSLVLSSFVISVNPDVFKWQFLVNCSHLRVLTLQCCLGIQWLGFEVTVSRRETMASQTTLNINRQQCLHIHILHLLRLKNVYYSVNPHVTVKQKVRALLTVSIISDASTLFQYDPKDWWTRVKTHRHTPCTISDKLSRLNHH